MSDSSAFSAAASCAAGDPFDLADPDGAADAHSDVAPDAAPDGEADGFAFAQPQPGPQAEADPSAEFRADGPDYSRWTRRKMVVFLRELAATQSVEAAARGVGMSRTSAYNLRNRLHGTPFALGWEVALEMGLHQLAHVVLDRAINGEERPVYWRGELVGTRRRYDNNLARWLLANPWMVGRNQIAREWSSSGFDWLLERIEHDSLDWKKGEAVPGGGPRRRRMSRFDAECREDRFVRKQSWYSDLAAKPRPK